MLWLEDDVTLNLEVYLYIYTTQVQGTLNNRHVSSSNNMLCYSVVTYSEDLKALGGGGGVFSLNFPAIASN